MERFREKVSEGLHSQEPPRTQSVGGGKEHVKAWGAAGTLLVGVTLEQLQAIAAIILGTLVLVSIASVCMYVCMCVHMCM